MTEPTIEIFEAQQDGSNIYYRVSAKGAEKPSLLFVIAPDRTVHGGGALNQWCEHNQISWSPARSLKQIFLLENKVCQWNS